MFVLCQDTMYSVIIFRYCQTITKIIEDSKTFNVPVNMLGIVSHSVFFLGYSVPEQI